MAISARSRRGTSSSFWRNHNAMQTMLAQACMPSIVRSQHASQMPWLRRLPSRAKFLRRSSLLRKRSVLAAWVTPMPLFPFCPGDEPCP